MIFRAHRPERGPQGEQFDGTQQDVIEASPAGDLEAHAVAAESFLRSIANRHRLMVLCSLVEGEISAGELSRRLGLTQSNLSRHLATLREEGLVATRREATTIYYRIASDRVRTILETLHGMFCAGTGIC